jgi:hypothetical protein
MNTDEIFNEFPNLTPNSNILDVGDGWDFIYLVVKCEEVFDIQIWDSEVEILERNNVKVSQLFEYFDFLKNQNLTEFVNRFFIENKNDLIKIRQNEIALILDKKINNLINITI